MIKKRKKKYSKYFKIYLLVLAASIFISFLFYNHLSKDEINEIVLNIKNHNVLFKVSNNGVEHLKILSVTLVFSLIYIGAGLFIGLLVSEFFKISLKMIFLSKIYKTSGFIYGLFYNLINSGLFILLSYYYFKKLLKIFKKLYLHKFKNENINYNEVYNYIIKALFIIILILISDFIIFIYGDKVLSVIKNICKV